MEAKTTRDQRRGFTLVEMLTVIIIIGILASLVVVAAVPAIRRAREYTIRQEINQLELALEKYKQQRGDYPPDFAGVGGGATNDGVLKSAAQNAVLRHFRTAFPRYRPGASIPDGDSLDVYKGTYIGLLYDINYATRSEDGSDLSVNFNTGYGTGIDALNIPLTPATAMVFMLGGPPAPEGLSPKLLGFSANPANPFARGGSRLTPLYEFDETRVHFHYDGNGVPEHWATFIPPHMPKPSEGCPAPYVYFRPRNRDYFRTRSTGVRELPFFCDLEERGICTPYADTATFASGDPIDVNRWMEPTKFQIICAGLDGLFREPLGVMNDPPDGHDLPVISDDVDDDFANHPNNIRFLNVDQANIAPEEDDNITSFTRGKLSDRAEE